MLEFWVVERGVRDFQMQELSMFWRTTIYLYTNNKQNNQQKWLFAPKPPT